MTLYQAVYTCTHHTAEPHLVATRLCCVGMVVVGYHPSCICMAHTKKKAEMMHSPLPSPEPEPTIIHL